MGTLRDFLRQADFFHDVLDKSDGAIDFHNKVVQFDDDPNAVASGEATLLFSGPPVWSKVVAGTNQGNLVPIGTVQGISDGGSVNVQPYREIGSKIKRFARGSADYSVTVGKVITWHSNLLHAFYAWIPNLEASKSKTLKMLLAPGNAGDVAGNRHFTNLDSDLFGVPFGLALVTITADGQVLSKEYWEKIIVGNLGKQISAGQPIIQEQVQLLLTRKVPADELNITDAIQKDFILRLGNTPGT